MIVQPYLFFEGRCEEAMAFYKQAVGAQVTMMMRYKDSPDQPPGPQTIDPNKVMHANFQIGKTQIMASDGYANNAPKFEGFSLSISLESTADAERIFKALSTGGSVQMPLTATFFARTFGMVTDPFGVSWMLIVPIEDADCK